MVLLLFCSGRTSWTNSALNSTEVGFLFVPPQISTFGVYVLSIRTIHIFYVFHVQCTVIPKSIVCHCNITYKHLQITSVNIIISFGYNELAQKLYAYHFYNLTNKIPFFNVYRDIMSVGHVIKSHIA